MEKEFWLQRWADNELGFHLDRPHHSLRRFFPAMEMAPGETIFVPLCGKSPDLVWLHRQNLKVIGIELSRLAVDAFFAENDLRGRWQDTAGMACCVGDGYALFCGDIFHLTAESLGSVSGAYDRGALVALPADMRSDYALKMTTLMPGGGRLLLISYAYNQEETCGPPFAVPISEIEALFGAHWQIKLLHEEDVLWSHRALAQRGVSRLTEFVVLLTRTA